MSTCTVKTVVEVEQHPSKEHLSVVRLADGAQLVSMKLEDGTPRYKTGDLVVHIPDGALLSETLMRRLDVWDHEKNQGSLKGPNKNRIKASNFSGIRSEGMLLPANDLKGLVDGPVWIDSGVDLASALSVTF